ncbi:unnamed protein product [Sphagnum jensenii]|uniref:Trigger factor ribosome-binding bacterial domain-containing protein n=1 Tax=Sphagnum jensenii TaxID=128206 RepID=A0ABP0WAZ7_9BRYO
MAMVSIAHQAAAALRCNASSNSHGVVRGGTGLNPTTPSQFSCKSMSSSISGYSLSRINGSRLPFCQRQSILTISATFSGEGPIMSKSSLSMIKDASITAEPPQDQKIKVRVDFAGKHTQRAYDTVLRGLAKTAPPVPGFRRAKGGKTSIVPTNILLNMMGVARVRKFVVEEIVRTTLVEYVEKEGIKAKKNLTTDQSADELDTVFEPGKEFGFNATLELEDDEAPEEVEESSLETTKVEEVVAS